MQVLIVDDESRARQSMKALLGVWYPETEVHEAADGWEAVRLAETLQPDLILMDGRMPEMNGPDAIRIIKARSPHIKIVVLSMYPDIEAEALAAGADAFVSKSDAPDRLRKTLAEVLV
jgi:CheY-like chemotaxis protein